MPITVENRKARVGFERVADFFKALEERFLNFDVDIFRTAIETEKGEFKPAKKDVCETVSREKSMDAESSLCEEVVWDSERGAGWHWGGGGEEEEEED